MEERAKAGAAAAGSDEMMNGKPQAYWEGVFERLKDFTVKLEMVKRKLEANGNTNGAMMAEVNIDDILEVLVLADFMYTQKYGKSSEALMPGKRHTVS